MVDLEGYDEMYESVEAGGEFDPVPDGTHQVFIDEIVLTETKKDPVRPMLSWRLQIIGGECEGRKLFKNAVVNINDKDTTERSLKFIKTDLSICGLADCKFSELNGRVHELKNVQLEVKVDTKPLMKNGKQIVKKGKKQTIQNIWIQKKISVNIKDDIPF